MPRRLVLIVARPLLLGAAISSSLLVLPAAYVATIIGWVLLLLAPLSLWMAWLLLRAHAKHPEDALLGNQAEIAVVAAVSVMLIALTCTNYLLGGPRGLGLIPLITAVLLIGSRPVWFLVAYYRGRF